MLDSGWQTTVIERPVFFPPDERTYFGFLSLPREPSCTTAVVLLSGTSGGTTTVGRNRMWVHMARRLAEHGFSSLRLDYQGLGDSLGEFTGYDLENPALDELAAGIDLLAATGSERFVLVGTCFGARTALAGAAQDPRAVGVLLFAPPVRNSEKGVAASAHLADYESSLSLAKKALNLRVIRKLIHQPRTRATVRRIAGRKLRSLSPRRPEGDTSVDDPAPGFARPLTALMKRSTPVRIVFGTEDRYWVEYQRLSDGRLGKLIARHSDVVTVRTVPGVVRGFLTERVQGTAIDEAVEWAEGLR